MTITAQKLTGAAGLAAVAAGLISILIQFIHPADTATPVTTVEWVVASLRGDQHHPRRDHDPTRRHHRPSTMVTRAYALAFGAATHVFTIGIRRAILGASELTNALMQGARWVITLAIAERAIRRRPGCRTTPALVEIAIS